MAAYMNRLREEGEVHTGWLRLPGVPTRYNGRGKTNPSGDGKITGSTTKALKG
jgi:hypothetical protein